MASDRALWRHGGRSCPVGAQHVLQGVVTARGSTERRPGSAMTGLVRPSQGGHDVCPKRLPSAAGSLVLAALFAVAFAIPAAAAVPHTVQPGETLWSIAAA